MDYLPSRAAQLQIASRRLCRLPVRIGLEASGFNLKMLQDGEYGLCLPDSFLQFPVLQNTALLPPMHVSCKPVAPAALLLPLCPRGFSPARHRMQKTDHPGGKHRLLGCQTMGYAHPTAAKTMQHSINVTWNFGPPKCWSVAALPSLGPPEATQRSSSVTSTVRPGAERSEQVRGCI